MAYKNSAYHDDSDTDDQYDRRLAPSPNEPSGVGFESSSPTDSESPSAENTPTTFTHLGGSGSSPRGLMTQWSAEQCADFISNLGLVQYADTFVGMCSIFFLILGFASKMPASMERFWSC